MPNIESLISAVKQVAIEVHQELGPGLLESVYEDVFVDELTQLGFQVDSQLMIPLQYKARTYKHAYRLDILLEGRLIVELKSAERMSPLFSRQVLTYLRCLKLRHGLVVSMGLERAIDGIDRVVNFRVPPEPGDS